MEQFDAVDQSGKRMGRPSLYSQPIHIEIVMGPSHDEALELIKKGEGGMGRRSREIQQGVDLNNLIPVHNENLNPPANIHCLLLAVQLKILYVNLEKTNVEKKKFHRLINGQNKRAKIERTLLIKEMLQQMPRYGIRYPTYAPQYTVEEHVPLIQRFLDLRFPGKYRISVFGEQGRIRPIWKGAERAEHEIALYLKGEHYYGIRNLNALFGSYYCIDCEAPYTQKYAHRNKCIAKCPRCCGIGYGFPCKVIEGYSKKCLQCANTFKNPDCFKRHTEKGICKIYKRCEKCGHIYRSKKDSAVTQKSDSESTDDSELTADTNNNGHICFIHYCNLCRSFHKREERCYVQPLIPKKEHEYLLIVFDFECELISPTRNKQEWQHLQNNALMPLNAIPDDENYQVHHVNCALLMCSRCIRNDNWKNEKTGRCKTCGMDMPRMRTWTAADFLNPLREFLEWLINGLGNERSWKTYAISHYGGFLLLYTLFSLLI
uniref:Uncharacterized protein n=2 Tax=Meloidogyne enterolobii TaxID=390850 RepID=A0A6V7XVD5_MELEN|nr:unnamed protein product [Meloidogyne enterolobii]